MSDLNFNHALDATREDKWITIDVDEEELDGSKISGTSDSQLTEEEVEDYIGNGVTTGLTYDDVAGEFFLDESYAATWTSQHQFSAGLDTRGDIVDGATLIWDSAGGHVEQTALENDTVTVAGNAVALGGTTAIGTADLSGDTDGLTEGTSNLFYTDERAQDAVGTILSADFTYDDATPAINMDPHATDASAHHAKYTDEEAQDAVGLNFDATLAYDDATPSFGVASGGIGTTELDLSIAPTWTGNHTFNSTVDANLFAIDGSTVAQSVAASGQVTLSSGVAVVDTAISAVDATFTLALGVDDPNADTKVSGRLFWDDSAGTYKVEIVESDTSVGNPTVNYDIVRVR